MAKQPEKTLETKPSTKPQTDDGWGPEELEKVLDKIPQTDEGWGPEEPEEPETIAVVDDGWGAEEAE